MSRTRLIASCLAASVAGAVAAPASAQVYRLTPVATTPDVAALNDLGQVVGGDARNSLGAFVSTPYLWSNGLSTSLAGFGIVSAQDINNAGQITGALAVPRFGSDATHAYLYAGGRVKDLDPSGLDSVGTSINGAGLVAGRYASAGGAVDAALFGSAPTNLGVALDATLPSAKVLVNNSGLVAGTALGSTGAGPASTVPFVYAAGRTTAFDRFGGAFDVVNGLNASGAVVGTVSGADVADHAFVYDRGTATNLDPGAHFLFSNGAAINDGGMVTGGAQECTPDASPCNAFAFIYSNGRVRDLNTMLDPQSAAGWHLTAGVDINNRGQIVGYGFNELGQDASFLLTPVGAVPEPESLALMLAGLGALGVLRRRGRCAGPKATPLQ